MWQAVVAGLLVAAGVAILAYRLYGVLSGKRGCACGCGKARSGPAECPEEDNTCRGPGGS